MMLALKNAESNKGMSEVVTAVILITISLVAVILVFNYTKKYLSFSPEESFTCIDYENSIELKNVCNRNNETFITISRNIDSLKINSLIFSLQPSGAKWILSGEKCLDSRISTKSYGNYCTIISPGMQLTYVLNTSDIINKKYLSFSISGSKLCEISKKEITECNEI